VYRQQREYYNILFETGVLEDLKGVTNLNDVFAYLEHYHLVLSSQIEAAVPALTSLINAHASFPFLTDTPPGKDRPSTGNALLHSLALLRSNCTFTLKQSSGLGNEPCILSRSVIAGIEFMLPSWPIAVVC
jgi:hypothetical protein